jgi:hypothetical protein
MTTLRKIIEEGRNFKIQKTFDAGIYRVVDVDGCKHIEGSMNSCRNYITMLVMEIHKKELKS